MQPDEPNKVEKLNESLYSRTQYKAPEEEHHAIQPRDISDTQDDWQSPHLNDMIKQDRRKASSHSFLKKLFIFALVFCIGAAGVAAFIYLGGGNLISSKNVDITVDGPVSISAGDTVDLGITITNRNNADLALTNLSIDYPDGAKDPVDPTKALTHVKVAIGDLAAGKNIVEHQSAEFFGQKGDTEEVTITVDYQIKGSNATFSKQKVYDIAIADSPLSIQVDQPSSVTSGDAFLTTLTVQSNASDILKNIVIKGDYPYGFVVASTSPFSASKDLNFWALGDLAPGDKKTIIIKGSLTGEDADQRTFRFYAGVGDGAGALATTLSLTSDTVNLSRPDVALDLSFNGDNTNPYVAPAGSPVSGSIHYQNNLPQGLTNTKVVATLTGASLDKFSIKADNGFYSSSNNTITWSSQTDPVLSSVGPGDSGVLSFSFVSQNNLALNSKNPQITVSTVLSGAPQGGSSSDNVSVSASDAVQLGSMATLSSKSLYSRGPLTNTGPFPPKAEASTTYTVVLDLGNTQNDITNSKVTGTLGPNVNWVTSASSTENLSYDASSNTVTWNVGTLAAGTGFSIGGREAVFQVSITPSIGQVGSAPILFANPVFSGTDILTQRTITVSNQSVTTRASTDPKFVQGDELVVK